MKLPVKRKGLFLVSAILVSFAIALFVVAALRLSIGNLKATQKGSRQAVMAADSGLQYVQSRLSEDPLWNGDGGLVVNTPELVVYEHRGNIIGMIAVPEGGFAQFRIRFNYQDDSTDNEDGYQDPAPQLAIDSPYVSVNNLFGGAPKGVPRAGGPNWAVDSSSPREYFVPGHSVCVISEGRYGPGLNPSPTDINPAVVGSCATRVVEAYLEPGNLEEDKAGSMSAGNTTFQIETGGQAQLGAKDPKIASRLRSRGEIRVLGGATPNLISTDENGETYTPSGNITASQDGSVDLETELSSTDFYRLNWDEIRKATSGDANIDAGTYTVWDDGTIHYYDMPYAAFAAHTVMNPSDPGTDVTASLPASVTFDNSQSRLTISDNVYVKPTAATSEFTFIPRAGVQEDPPGAIGLLTPQVKMEKLFATLGDPVLSNKGGGGIISSSHYRDATWTIPLPPGTNVKYEKKKRLVFKKYLRWGIYLEETSPGVGTLRISDGDDPFSQSGVIGWLDFGSVDAIATDPLGSLEHAFVDLLRGKDAVLHDILTPSVVGSTLQEFDFSAGAGFPGTPPVLRADNLTVEFKPNEGKTAVLTAEGGVRLGAVVKGEGGSITSEDTIRVVGTGSELESSLANGLTLYAKKDVVFSSLKESNPGSGDWYYKDLNIKGVVYSWGGVDMKLGADPSLVSQFGALKLEGAIVAYGGDPAGAPGANSNGTIRAELDGLDLIYNPAYFYGLVNTPPPARFHQTLYNPY